MLRKNGTWHFLVYLALLSIVGFLSTDMYLPAFDQMRQYFGTNKAQISLSLSLFLGGFAGAQLLWGPLSDRYGKARTIIWGMGIFILSSIGIFFAQQIYWLLSLRLIQAIGACSAAVSWQALVIERFSETERPKVFANIMPLVALSPALAPLLGAVITQHWGWPYIFAVLAAIGSLLLLYSFSVDKQSFEVQTGTVTETKPIQGYVTLLQAPYYLGNVLIYGLCSAGFFAWLTGAPFFLYELGYDEQDIGLSFVPQTLAFIVGGYGYRTIAGKIKGIRLLPYLIFTYVISMIALLLVAVFTEATLTTLLIPFCVMAFSNGATYPIVVDQALQQFPNSSGKASALQNTLQLGLCFIASMLVSLFSQNALIATSTVMVGTAILVAPIYYLTHYSSFKNA